MDRENVCAGDRQSAAGFNYFRARHERFATRRPQQIDLKLHAEHRRAGGHQAERCVTTRRIRNRRHNSSVKIAILLGQILTKWQDDLYDARFDQPEPRANQIHDRLFGEALRDCFGKCGIE